MQSPMLPRLEYLYLAPNEVRFDAMDGAAFVTHCIQQPHLSRFFFDMARFGFEQIVDGKNCTKLDARMQARMHARMGTGSRWNHRTIDQLLKLRWRSGVLVDEETQQRTEEPQSYE